MHVPFWGLAHGAVAGVQGLLLTAVYMWRRNLWTNIVAHALLDGFVFLALDIVTAHGTTNL
jgi:membrane protease YdiL (CAAX protease family)